MGNSTLISDFAAFSIVADFVGTDLGCDIVLLYPEAIGSAISVEAIPQSAVELEAPRTRAWELPIIENCPRGYSTSVPWAEELRRSSAEGPRI